MVARKRARGEMEEATPEPTLLQKIRNMWEFASLMQYFFLFGKAVKIDDMEVEVCPSAVTEPSEEQKLNQAR